MFDNNNIYDFYKQDKEWNFKNKLVKIDKRDYIIENNTTMSVYGYIGQQNDQLDNILKRLTPNELVELVDSMKSGKDFSNSMMTIITARQNQKRTNSIVSSSQLKFGRSIAINQNQAKKIIKEEIQDVVIQRFITEMFNKHANSGFRGWILPNGLLLSQYDDESIVRQDHSKLIKLFMEGLEIFNKDLYDKMILLYSDYVLKNSNARDIYESFAVDVLGWIQISECGSRRLICVGERWQDKLISPFINEYGMELILRDNVGLSHSSSFGDIYGETEQIMQLGLEKKYGKQKVR